jgi:xanthine dehydrogenase YagT iron-sulfur-binding subunit
MTSRPGFLQTTGGALLVVACGPALAQTTAEAALPSERVRLTINGRRYALDVDPRTTLLDALREHLGLTGSPAGALHPMQAAFVRHDGLQCGYCTPGQICSAVAAIREQMRYGREEAHK